jgi:sarcosine oxidase subunit gamma
VTDLHFTICPRRDRFGLKGPGAEPWLAAHGIPLPPAPNSWTGATHADDPAIWVARLGAAEFFLEDHAGGTTLRGIEPSAESHPPGVYPVLREDASFLLAGQASLEVLAQVCNVDFGNLPLEARPVIMTSMIGVSVLVAPQIAGARTPGAEPARGGAHAPRQYRIWCDPSFGPYLGESLGTVVRECGGQKGSI